MATFPRTLAVDLGASAVRLIELGPDNRGRPMVLALEDEEIAYDPGKTSDFFALYAQALQAALGRLATKTRQCHLCLGGPAVFARILKVPTASPGKVKAMIGFEAQQTVPAIEQACWDSQLLPSSEPGGVEALILAIKKETVEEMSAAAASVGLKAQSVTLAPAALLNGFFFNYPEVTGCQLILEMGTRATTILLVEESRIFVRVVPLGGAAITQAVATDLQESFVGAEILKKAKGFVHPGGAYEDPADAATARISKLARGVMTRLHTEVERSITFFRSQQGGGKPQQAWLAGGGSALGYTDLFFREKLRIPVEAFQPFRRLTLPPMDPGRSPTRIFSAWATAVGTAFQALPDAPVRINVQGLLGQHQAQKSRDVPAQVIAAVALALLLFLPGAHGIWQAAKSAEKLQTETQRVEEAARALDKLESANRKFVSTTQQMETLLRLEQERLRWPRLLRELQKQTPARLWITGLKVLGSDEVAFPSGGQAKPGEPTGSLVEIAGMFETQSEKADSLAVDQFQKALEEGKVLKNVTILERETPRYVDGKTDQVALRFRLKADWPLPASEKTAFGGGGK